MKPGKDSLIVRSVKLLHYLGSCALFYLAWKLFCEQQGIQLAPRYHVFVLGLFALALLFFIRIYDGYMINFSTVSELSFSLGLADIFSVIIVYGLTGLAWNRLFAPWYLLALLPVLILLNALWTRAAVHLHKKLVPPLKCLLIYRRESDLRHLSDLERFPERYTVTRRVEAPASFEELLPYLKEAEAVFLAGIDASLRNGIAKYCVENGLPGFILPHVGDILLTGAFHVHAFHSPIFCVRRAHPKPEYLLAKRALDIFVSLVGLIVLSPLFLITALMVRCYDGGPAIYRQKRLTQGGRIFEILKFRSMRVDAEKDGVARLATEGDSRITPVGRFIRACRLDELPQLINILKGEMSLVGPRPERPEIAAQYEEKMPAFRLRLQVKAGLTGYAQVYGKYNTDPYAKLEMDLIYINKMSFITDLQLIIATVRTVFTKESTEGIGSGKITADGSAAESAQPICEEGEDIRESAAPECESPEGGESAAPECESREGGKSAAPEREDVQ